MNTTILVTGGAGYIGSHTTLELLESGFDVVVIDNLSNSSAASLKRVERICGRAPIFIHGDVRDRTLLRETFANYRIHAVIHFAGLKSVGESVAKPLEYYDNNVNGSVTLLEEMSRAQIYRLAFSSSATVYGTPKEMPIRESSPTGNPTNPYGNSKLITEEILTDLSKSDSRWSIALLRYFNPVGGHESGLLGEAPNGRPNNLIPYISQVAIGKHSELMVYGDDYPTHDGTGIRDYIHVMDLAKGHIKALNFINSQTGINTWNLGTGIGYSVLEMIKAFSSASGKSIPYRIVPRRPGDIAKCWADAAKAAKELNWTAERGLETMMIDTWRWQSLNPNGYEST